MEFKYIRKRAAAQIKKLATSKAALVNSDRNMSVKVPHKEKASICVLLVRKQQFKKTHKNYGSQSYCVLWKKSLMPERNWKLHSSQNCFGRRSDQSPIKDVLEGGLGNTSDAVKYYHKSEKKWKSEYKYLKKQNKIFFSMDKHSGSLHELKNINNIHA